MPDVKYCYTVRPLSGQQKYTSQTKYRGTRTSQEAVAALVERTGQTKEQVEEVLQNLGQYLVEQAMDCWQVDPLLGWFGFRGTSGGSHPTPDFMPSFTSLAIDIRSHLGPQAWTYAEQLFAAEGLGHHGLVRPEFVRVTNTFNGLANTYTPGKSILIELRKGRCSLDPSDTTQGVFFTASNGTRVRSTDYGLHKGCRIICGVPTGLTGQQELSVSVIINGGLRTGVFGNMLQLMTSEEAPAAKPEHPPRPSRRNGKGAGNDIVLSS